MVKLGQRVQDQITGFVGMVTGRVEYLTGCAQVLVQPEVKKESGDWIESRWLDEPRVLIVDQTIRWLSVPGFAPGRDIPAPRR